jgi:predicted MFS family arabinose efflux permease
MDNKNLDRPLVVAAAAGSGTAAILVFAMMPVLVGGMADRFALNDLQSGLVATGYFSTYALAALTSPLWIRRLNWRVMTVLGFAVMVASLGLALVAPSYVTARLALAASGLGAAVLFPVSLTLVSDMKHPERAYAIKIAVEQLVPAGLLIILSTGVFLASGLNSTLIAILAAVVLCLVASAAMPAAGTDVPETGGRPLKQSVPGLLALVALGINFAGFAGLWVFMERLGAERGFDDGFISLWLAVGLISSGIGPLVAAGVADRWGRVYPLVASTVAALASILFLAGDLTHQAYALALILLPLTYYFGISYIFSTVASADESGRISGLMSFALAVGSATGPALFGATRSAGGPVLLVMGVCLAAGALLIILIARQQDAVSGVLES